MKKGIVIDALFFSYLPPKLCLCYLTSLKTVDDYFTLYFNKEFFTSFAGRLKS